MTFALAASTVISGVHRTVCNLNLTHNNFDPSIILVTPSLDFHRGNSGIRSSDFSHGFRNFAVAS